MSCQHVYSYSSHQLSSFCSSFTLGLISYKFYTLSSLDQIPKQLLTFQGCSSQGTLNSFIEEKILKVLFDSSMIRKQQVKQVYRGDISSFFNWLCFFIK